MTFNYYHQSLLLLGAQPVLSGWVLTAQNNFFYHSYQKGNGSKESRVLKRHIFAIATDYKRCLHIQQFISVASAVLRVVAARGDKATIPCRFWYEPELSVPREVRVKWTWRPAAGGPETEVLVATGSRASGCEAFGWVRTSVSESFAESEPTLVCVVCCSGDACISDGIFQEMLRS